MSSATHVDGGPSMTPEGIRQMLYLAVGCLVYVIVKRIDYHDWADAAWLLYAGGLVVLAITPLIARPIGGARAWIELGPVSLQPSEPMKALVVLGAAAFLASSVGKLSFDRLVRLGLIVGTPVLLIMMQPDLGTALTFIPMALALAWLAGIRPRVLLALALVAALAAPLMWFVVLKDYQKERIVTVFDPTRDPKGTGYQIIQSRIAVGSGGVLGKGSSAAASRGSTSCPRGRPTSSLR
ncbi:MAG: FtsW/RodA/SpoVE family cell cycle protein [Acidobacteria bacterium]|nr:FtsW/RodA/SpoVE family cell cycle protein [Acidobacteriota bacterium]